jgi:uncharacterized protein YndB with AHSA1/START domain
MSTAPAVRARVRHRVSAQAEDVFDAWIDPAKIREWFAPGLGDVTRAETDPRVGGAFCIVQRRAGGDATHEGEYLELERPRRLAFTWRTPPEQDRSKVHVDIASSADGCDVTLTHEMEARYASTVEKVEHGWTTMLDGMAGWLERRAGDAPTR